MKWAIGIDVGGSQLKAVAVTKEGVVRQRVSRATNPDAAVAAEWIAVAHALIDELRAAQDGAPATIGLCAPGLVAADGRSIAHLPGKLAGLAGIEWCHALARGPVGPILNDAHAAILGEAWIGAACGQKHVVMLTLGTGVGGAVISDGRLLRGAIGRAGHIGHLSLDPEGMVSITGMPGAIETMIGDCTVVARTAGRFAHTTALVAAHLAGDAEATRVWLKSIRALSCAVGSCINLFDPGIVIIGGGMAQAGAALFGPLAAELARIEWRPQGQGVPVVPATLGSWAGAIGAAHHAFFSHESH
jgi:glucokinase